MAGRNGRNPGVFLPILLSNGHPLLEPFTPLLDVMLLKQPYFRGTGKVMQGETFERIPPCAGMLIELIYIFMISRRG